ncbi:MAG TPA: MXAN_6640 family putative metalloprotease [Solirubrobacterales bacterium]|nr:MXAN_6640 family putative metalloprotease [Solirubrobacterales bacterium]
MRNRRRHLVGTSAALLLFLAASAPARASFPSADGTKTGLSNRKSARQQIGAAQLASHAQKPFIVPQSRPTERRSRPTDGNDPDRNAYSVPEAPSSPACSQHFCVHWVDQGLDAPDLADRNGDSIPDFVERVLKVAEHVHAIENGELGWREPKSDGRRGGGTAKTDVYLAQIGGELFGYAAPDRGQADRQHRIPRHLHGYLVLDNDYSAFEFPHTKPVNDLEVTFAHEYNHILQFAYDAYQDPWFAESTATWMEDQVYNRINDYLRYVRRWVRLYETPLTTSSIKMYGSAVWNTWLARRYGRAFIRRAWAGAIEAKPGGFAVASYERALRAAKASPFSLDFTRFAAAVAEWRTGRGFRESRLYPDMPREGRLPLDGERLTRLLNHTTFELLRVSARQGRAVVVQMTAPWGTASGLALVGRLGSERRGRTVNRIAYRRSGGQLTVRLRDPGRFQRITAVVVNADARAHGFSARRLDWRYLTDRFPFELSARLVR